MAGDWIKLQKDTPDKPEVLAMAARLNIDSDAVVGKLVRVWSWFDTHTVDGNASCVTFALLDRLSGVTGFAEQMQLVGWLHQSGHQLTLANFNYHNGDTGKTRALGKNRAGKARSNANSNDACVTKSLPEKRREEKIVNTLSPPIGVDAQVWQDFQKLRKTLKAPITDTAMSGINREAEKAGLTLDAALTMCVERSWRGFKSDWATKENTPTNNPFAGGM